MIRIASALMFLSMSLGATAAAVSPGNYSPVEPEFRGNPAKLKAKMDAQERLSRGRAQLIVLPFNVKAVPDVANSGGATKGQNALKTDLIRGGAQIIDRALPSQVQSELEYIEATGTSRGVSSDIADFLFQSEVLTAEATTSYSEARSYTNSDGQRVHVPAKCNLNGTSTVSVLFFTMNPLALQKSMVLEGSASSEIKNISSHNCARQNPRALKVEAMKNAVEKNGDKIQDLFSPVGYIKDRRYDSKKGDPAKGKKMIFLTSLPNKISTQANTRVIVYKEVERVDPWDSSKKSIEKAQIGVGKVLQVVGDNSVWIKMDKSASAAEVLLGDIVEVVQNTKGVCKTFDVACHARNAKDKMSK